MGPLRGEQKAGEKDGHRDAEGHKGESCEWQEQGYKRNCCESCPAKQLKCIIPSWEKRERKQLRSCPAYYKCWAHIVICTVPTPGKKTSCIHLILLESPSRSEFLPSSERFQAEIPLPAQFYKLKQKENKI